MPPIPHRPAGFTPGGNAELLATGQHVAIISTPRLYRPHMRSAQALTTWIVDIIDSQGHRYPVACDHLDPVRPIHTNPPAANVLPFPSHPRSTGAMPC
jgi:hypothetical protein